MRDTPLSESGPPQNVRTTLTGGIQDVSALLPLLGTDQCEHHVGSALEGALEASVLSKSEFPSSFPAFPSRNFLFLIASSPSTSMVGCENPFQRRFQTGGDRRSSDRNGWNTLLIRQRRNSCRFLTRNTPTTQRTSQSQGG